MSTYIRPTVDYSTFPDTDDEPMADTEDNQALMIDTIFALRHRLEPEGHHVGGNLLVYYNPASGLDHLSPDVFVALGSGPERRKKWETWIEGKFPELIVEFASPGTSDRDVGEKIDLYSRLGAEEYYIFDPIPLLQPPFQAYRRSGRRLVAQDIGPEQRIASPVTGLIFGIVDGWLRVIDPASGSPYPTPEEVQDLQRQADQARRHAEHGQRDAERGNAMPSGSRGHASTMSAPRSSSAGSTGFHPMLASQRPIRPGTSWPRH